MGAPAPLGGIGLGVGGRPRGGASLRREAHSSLAGKMTYNVAIIGGGTMGVGIAYVAALAKGSVIVVEPDDNRAAAMTRTVQDAIASAVARGKLDEAGGRALSARM